MGCSTLQFKELHTLLVEVEATLNNRPITYMYDDHNGISNPLTPASLIYCQRVSQTVNETQVDCMFIP